MLFVITLVKDLFYSYGRSKVHFTVCNAVTYRATGLAAVFYIYFSLLEHN